MQKEIEYFLEKEQEFCNEHPDYGAIFFDPEIGEMSEVGINDRNNFLSDKTISSYYSQLGSFIGNEEQFNLSDAQRVVLRMFYCKDSVLFRDDYYYEGKNDIVQNLLDTLDSVVEVAPLNKDKLLYRFCVDQDNTNMKKGEIVTFAHNLTCTNYDWGQGNSKNVYLITPLAEGKTKAHNLYEIYEHGDEKQVDFKRGTSFKVAKVEETEGSPFKKIYLEELP